MELGKKIKQLRKFSGMTQEQLAEKLNISRQALSKWENGTSMPDVESVVRISMLFQISLEELLIKEEKYVEESKTQITLEDLTQINLHNRRMNLLLSSGILFLAIGIMGASFVKALETTTESMGYIMYRYMVTGNYVSAPVDYIVLYIPVLLIGMLGIILCVYYFVKYLILLEIMLLRIVLLGNCETSSQS